MTNKTIAQHITIPAAILGTVTVLLAVLRVFAITTLSQTTDSLAQRSLPALRELSKMDQSLCELRKSVILQSSAKSPAEALSFDHDIHLDIDAVRQQENEYGRLPADSQDRELTRTFESSLDPLSSAMTELSALSNQGKRDDAVNAFHVRFLPAFDSAEDTERRRTTVRLASASQLASGAGRFAKSSLTAAWAGSALALALCAVVCLYSKGRVTRELTAIVGSFEDNAARLAACVLQVSCSSHALSNGSSQQAASIEEISSSVEEMSAMTLRNSENSARASAMMADTSVQVSRSHIALNDMIASMDAIKLSSEKVAKINRTIDEIAFQTNILALNAAVEAARAGDAGMGFAVVADEVRNLAQRSAAAAKDTALLIEEAIENTQKGSRKLDQVATVIKAITEGAEHVGHLLHEVKEASSQQAQGIAQISHAILQVNKITQQSAAGAEESAAASEELSIQAHSVQRAIQSLRTLAGFAKVPEAGTRVIGALPPSFLTENSFSKMEYLKMIDPKEPEEFRPMDAGQRQGDNAAAAQTFSSF
jgi:methyl-accepting chemotaxis protein